MTDFGAEKFRDEFILVARILLALLFRTHPGKAAATLADGG
jgi:hypothetical protein